MNTMEKAILIIESTKGELALGTRHYSDGKLLTTPLEIITALRDGKLIIEPTPERQWLFNKKYPYCEVG